MQVHACTCTCTHACSLAPTHACMHAHTHAHTHTYMCAHTQVYVCTHTYMCAHPPTHIEALAHMNILAIQSWDYHIREQRDCCCLTSCRQHHNYLPQCTGWCNFSCKLPHCFKSPILIKLSFWNLPNNVFYEQFWGCSSCGVYVPCIYRHTRWELP